MVEKVHKPEDHHGKATIYFGYGSNLWKHQMQQRCPTSTYIGIARLSHYRWIINERGYANIVALKSHNDQDTSSTVAAATKDHSHEVWGLIYTLQPQDEENLDINEGVPIAYEKQYLTGSFWPAREGRKPDIASKPEEVDMLVYINVEMVRPSKPKAEYVYRMNMGIKDALEEGMPKEYVEQVMRAFIPDVHDDEIEAVARKQALLFEDET